ncbi:hypothetical protein [Rhodopseudomonas palustris]|uniref:hypothetical protein n=1 Tax=Rhodopseudomonas palustris TaxID=1076 RepID=UPI0002EEB395|nr:hypothetical protein [Rhodopseudomonas palustris]
MNQQDQIARIERQQAEVRQFVSEQHKLMAEQTKLLRDAWIAPFALILTGMAAATALMGATVAAMRALGA